MSRTVIGLVILLATLLAQVGGGVAWAKKPPKPPPSPLGNPAIVYAVESDVHVITADGLDSQEVMEGGRVTRTHTAWSPDGSRIGFVEIVQKRNTVLSRTLYSVDPDGGNLTEVGAPPGDGPFDWIDGHRILVESWNGGDGDAIVMDISVNPPTWYRLGIIAELGLFANDPALTVDLEPSTPGYQGWLAFISGGDLRIVRVRDEDGILTPDPLTLLTLDRATPQTLPRWSRDATKIAFYDDGAVDTGEQLVVIEVALGGMPTFGAADVIIESDGHLQGQRFFYRPTWSPDGLWVAMVIELSDGDREVFRISPDGLGLTQLTDNAASLTESGVDWSPTWVNDID